MVCSTGCATSVQAENTKTVWKTEPASSVLLSPHLKRALQSVYVTKATRASMSSHARHALEVSTRILRAAHNVLTARHIPFRLRAAVHCGIASAKVATLEQMGRFVTPVQLIRTRIQKVVQSAPRVQTLRRLQQRARSGLSVFAGKGTMARTEMSVWHARKENTSLFWGQGHVFSAQRILIRCLPVLRN